MTDTHKLDKMHRVVRVNRFLSKGHFFALCHEAQGKVSWNGRFDCYKNRICFAVFLIPSPFITQNSLCGWIEICTEWMSFAIETGREKEGRELLLWPLFPLQGVTCLWSRRYLVVGVGERRMSHNLVFRLKGSFEDRWNYTVKVPVSLAYALRLASFRQELWGKPLSAERVVQV